MDMINDLKTPAGVSVHMAQATSEQDWYKRIDDVKAANNGDYPSFWFATIIMSGLVNSTAAKWGGDGQLKITISK